MMKALVMIEIWRSPNADFDSRQDGYTLFASNIALPMLAYVYWPDDNNTMKLTFINIATLAGTMAGQILFGILADKNGRRKMYGIELLLLIGSTLGVVMCSTGYNGSMNLFAWIAFCKPNKLH
jgi:MFS transporter, PHS family, inorganic phosphate transporter